jgi:hypothetical protein
MKKVLLSTTAAVITSVGMASAGDYSMSGSLTLTYGNFGTGSTAVTTPDDFNSEGNLNVAATSSGGAITMSGTLEIDEDSFATLGATSVSSGALTFTYDKNDIGALAMAPTVGDGEDDNYGDYSVAFSAGGIGVTYTKDQETSDNSVAVAYTAGALGLTLTSLDETNGAGTGYAAGKQKTTIGATYVTGPYTIKISGDDQTTQEWDASVAMASGDTIITVSADETEAMAVAIAYTAGSMTVKAKQEFNDPTDDETEISLSYTEGALTFSAASDSGQSGHYGDEAEMLISAAYTDGDVKLTAKGTDQDELQVAVTFSF